MTYADLKDNFGEPIFEMEVSHYTDEQILLTGIPEKIAIFSSPESAEMILVWGKVRENHWIPNYGHRVLIRELLKKCKVI